MFTLAQEVGFFTISQLFTDPQYTPWMYFLGGIIVIVGLLVLFCSEEAR